MVAEDNVLNQKIVTILLQKQGASVTTVPNGMLAIEQIQLNNFDLVLMDLQMPEMDGFETSLHIRNILNNDIPIVALSASNFGDTRTQCLAAGMNDCIPKPFDVKELNDVIAKLANEKKNPETLSYE